MTTAEHSATRPRASALESAINVTRPPPMKPHLLILAAALAATPLLASAANMVKVGDTGAAQVFVDKDSIRRTGTQARAALEWRWAKPTEVFDNPQKSYRMERQVQIANCENRSYAVAEGTQYADERGAEPVNSYKHDESALPFTVAPPRTIRDAVVLYVCAYVPPAKK